MNFIASSAFTTGTPAARKTGLTVTMDVFQVSLADMTVTKIVDAEAATEIGDGLYGYLVENIDLSTYAYYWNANTADASVNAQDVYAGFANLSAPTDLTTILSRLPDSLTPFGYMMTDVYKISGADPQNLGPAGVRVALGMESGDLDNKFLNLPQQIDTQLSGTHGADSWESGGGGGDVTLAASQPNYAPATVQQAQDIQDAVDLLTPGAPIDMSAEITEIHAS